MNFRDEIRHCEACKEPYHRRAAHQKFCTEKCKKKFKAHYFYVKRKEKRQAEK